MLSKLAYMSFSSLRKLDDEANKFYDRQYDLHEAALLTRCHTQHALHPYIHSEISHIRYFIKISFINNGIEFIDLLSTFRDNNVMSSIPSYFENAESHITNIKNLSVMLYLISINKFLILILKLILEIVKKLNFIINQRVILLLVV